MDQLLINPFCWMLAAPLLVALILLCLGKSVSGKEGLLSILGIAFSFVLVCYLFLTENVATQNSTLFLVDAYTMLMLLLITGISLLVQIFSLRYLKGDARYGTYWICLSVFSFAMMGLVLSGNLLLLYAFWEVVGFASYLLIGFWYTKESAAKAAQKAFLVNRIGDAAFLVGLFIIYNQCHTFSIPAILQQASIDASWCHWAGLCIAAGAIAKSAQFPLLVWLPDAMEGPTPVSALIHAATMVAAGIYLLARMFPVLDAFTLDLLLIIGLFTAFLAATTALVQYDIKKVLAYSTVSQLGLMVAGIGCGAVPAALFHLSTHAFFKALLFLGAGVMIHLMKHQLKKEQITADPQDMRLMAGMRQRSPVVFYVYVLAIAALIGLPFTSGFLSKDALLEAGIELAAERSGYWLLVPIVQGLVVLFTALYATRLLVLLFFRESKETFAPVRLGVYFLVPLVVLGAACLFPLFSWNPFHSHASGLWGYLGGAEKPITWLPLISILITFCGMGLSYRIVYRQRKDNLIGAAAVHRFLLKGWMLDALYDRIIVQPILKIVFWLSVFDQKGVDGLVNALPKTTLLIAKGVDLLDRSWIDGAVNGVAGAVYKMGTALRRMQTGYIQQYLIWMLLGILVAGCFFFL